ncbi:MAG: lipopolysaccharide/colanic/teichoic acid biosynthesis glycosyltransferase [Pirellulaceae bacterium]|jgi:lipopolysaccharide/colanic/teichoic acid biosynthesis glycosyltransferase/acetyltransferase-like isoleucine patch superfamily enzyme
MPQNTKNKFSCTHALVVATGSVDQPWVSAADCRPMAPVLDRPFLQHLVECLVDRGVTKIDFVLNDHPELIENHFGDGMRWGAEFRFHLTRQTEQPYIPLSWIDIETDGKPLLLLHADALQTNLEEAASERQDDISTYYWLDEGDASCEPVWSGVAWLPPGDLKEFAKLSNRDELGKELMSRAEKTNSLTKVPRPLMARTLGDILETQQRVLAGEFPQLLRASGQAADGIWIQRNVRLHPSVKLIPPVFINKNCQIDRNVLLGPNIVLGEGCIVDRGCTIRDSLILPESYIGEGLEIEESVVAKDVLYNVHYDVAISITDDLIMGSLADAGIETWLLRLASRLSAVVILALAWPALLITLLIFKISHPGTAVQSSSVVQLPRRGEHGRLNTFRTWWFGRFSVEPAEKMANRWTMWKHFFCEFLPGLAAVARGKQAFVGITPRTVEQMQQLPEEWRNLCYQSKAGVITEAFVQYGGNATQDELHTSEVFYAAVGSFRYDTSLLIRYFKTLLTGPQVSRTLPVIEIRTKPTQSLDAQPADQTASV